MLTRRDASWTQGTHITFRNLGKMNGSRGYQRKTNIYEVLEKGGGVSALWRKFKANKLDREMTRAMAIDIIQDAGLSVLELAAIVKETKGACPLIDNLGVDA